MLPCLLQIERMDERRRQRSLRDEAAAAAVSEAKQQQTEAPGQRGLSLLRSDESNLSNASVRPSLSFLVSLPPRWVTSRGRGCYGYISICCCYMVAMSPAAVKCSSRRP